MLEIKNISIINTFFDVNQSEHIFRISFLHRIYCRNYVLISLNWTYHEVPNSKWWLGKRRPLPFIFVVFCYYAFIWCTDLVKRKSESCQTKKDTSNIYSDHLNVSSSFFLSSLVSHITHILLEQVYKLPNLVYQSQQNFGQKITV